MSAGNRLRNGPSRLTPAQLGAVTPALGPAMGPTLALPAPAAPRPARPTPVLAPAAIPAATAVAPAMPAPPASAPRPRGPHRPTWTFIAVAPSLTTGVRRFELKRWHVRALAATVVGCVVAAFVGGIALGRQDADEQIDAAYGMLTDADVATGAVADTLRALRLAATLPAAVPNATGGTATVAAASTRATTRVGRVVLPVYGRITSYFTQSRHHPILGVWRSHLALDIAAPTGTPIRSPGAGRVARVERQLGYGLVVVVNHGRGVQTWYGHCNSTRVKVGERIAAGTVVATVGSSGLATGPHVHYEVRVNGRRVNPSKQVW